MKDSQPVGKLNDLAQSISKANNERFSTQNRCSEPGNKYIKGE